MSATITVVDETTSGSKHEALTLDFLDERVTVRELIRARVYQEVAEYNARRTTSFRGLISPAVTEQLLNGPQERRAIDWQRQYQRALEAFTCNGFLLLLNDRQLTELDETIDLHHDDTVTFLKLMPLVGG